MPNRALRHACALLSCVFFVLFILAPAANAQQVRQGLYRGMPVTYVLEHGKAIFQGDIILEKVQPINPQLPPPPSFTAAPGGATPCTVDPGLLWLLILLTGKKLVSPLSLSPKTI